MTNLVFAAALACVAALVVANLAAGMIVAAIQMRHPQVWKALGGPRPGFLHYPLNRSSIMTQRYIFSGNFRELADSRLSLWCSVFRPSLALAVALLLSLIVFAFAGLIA